MNSPPAESKFFDALRNRQGEAWEVFDERHGTWLKRALGRKVPHKLQHIIDVDDVIQFTFAKACERVATMEYRGEKPFRVFLYRVAWNRLQDRVRHHTRRRRDVDSEVRNVDVTLAPATRPEDRSPSSVCSRKEVSQDMFKAMATLPTIDRKIVWRRIVEGLKWNQIAASADCTPEAASRRFLRSMRFLAKLVRKHA